MKCVCLLLLYHFMLEIATGVERMYVSSKSRQGESRKSTDIIKNSNL